MDYNEFQTLSISVNGRGEVENLTKALESQAKAVDKVETSTGKASKAKQQFARDALQASQAAQDFATGGLLGITNNMDALGRMAGRVMPGLAAFFGGPTGLAAAAMGVGVAIYTLQDPVKALVGWLTNEGNGIPKATDAVAKLDDRLGEVKERLKELGKAWDGSSASVAEYNRLTAEQVGLEKQLTAAKKERAAIDAQRDRENAPDKNVTNAVGDAVKRAGGVDKVAADLAGAMPGAANAAQAQLDQLVKERAAALAGDRPAGETMDSARRRFAPQITAAEEALRQARGQAQAGASGVVGRALQGDPQALQQLARFLPGRGFDQVGATAAMPGLVKGVLGGVAGGAWEEQFRGGRMAADVAKAKRAGAATAAGMLGGFQAGAGLEDREGAGVSKALAPFRKADVDEWMKDLDRAERGGFSEDEADAAAAASSVVGRAGKEFRQTGRVDRVAPAEVERALSEAQAALNMQTTSDAPDMRIIETLSSLSSQLIQVKQQLANQNQQARFQGQQVRAMGLQFQGGPATGGAMGAITPFGW